MIRGIDASTCLTPFVPALRQAGVQFAARYYCRRADDRRQLVPSEVWALSSAGIALVSVFEHRSDHPGYFTEENARIDAAAALSRAAECQQPPGSTIYFAIDCDITPRTWPAVEAYLETIFALVNPEGYTVSVYGDDLVCLWCQERGLAQYVWLANAVGWRQIDRSWDGWDIKQGRQHWLVPGRLQVDDNEGRGLDLIGAWTVLGA